MSFKINFKFPYLRRYNKFRHINSLYAISISTFKNFFILSISVQLIFRLSSKTCTAGLFTNWFTAPAEHWLIAGHVITQAPHTVGGRDNRGRSLEDDEGIVFSIQNGPARRQTVAPVVCNLWDLWSKNIIFYWLIIFLGNLRIYLQLGFNINVSISNLYFLLQKNWQTLLKNKHY